LLRTSALARSSRLHIDKLGIHPKDDLGNSQSLLELRDDATPIGQRLKAAKWLAKQKGVDAIPELLPFLGRIRKPNPLECGFVYPLVSTFHEEYGAEAIPSIVEAWLSVEFLERHSLSHEQLIWIVRSSTYKKQFLDYLKRHEYRLLKRLSVHIGLGTVIWRSESGAKT